MCVCSLWSWDPKVYFLTGRAFAHSHTIRLDMFWPSNYAPLIYTLSAHIWYLYYSRLPCICKINDTGKFCQDVPTISLWPPPPGVEQSSTIIWNGICILHMHAAPVKPSSVALKYLKDVCLKNTHPFILFNSLTECVFLHYKTWGFWSIIHLICLKTE